VKTSEALRRTKPFVWNGTVSLYWKETVHLPCGCQSSPKVKRHARVGGCQASDAQSLPALRCGWTLPFSQMMGGKDVLKMQETRQAWLDYLITLYESEGD
jgi:hypothetical protein